MFTSIYLNWHYSFTRLNLLILVDFKKYYSYRLSMLFYTLSAKVFIFWLLQ